MFASHLIFLSVVSTVAADTLVASTPTEDVSTPTEELVAECDAASLLALPPVSPVAAQLGLLGQLEAITSTRKKDDEAFFHLDPAWSEPNTSARCLTGTTACTSCNSSIITLGLLYYHEPIGLTRHIQEWSSWPVDLQQRFEFLIFDDCSPAESRAVDVVSELLKGVDNAPSVRVLTALPPKRDWNIGGARNGIMSEAHGCWTMLLDLDYLVTSELARDIVENQVPGATSRDVFRFRRNDRPIEHPGIVLMQRGLYWEAGGCDEDFVGSYGKTDSHFMQRLKKHESCPSVIVPRGPKLQVNENLIDGRGTPKTANLSRSSSHNRRIYEAKVRGEAKWSNDYLRFNWTSVVVSNQGKTAFRSSPI